ncbi:Inner membrane protein translocase component YidC, OxaA protein [Streptococcus sp. DD13]|nr:Inner membrane protein translocase component YidC, OxaA protein [Streptococcus sp. DD13]
MKRNKRLLLASLAGIMLLVLSGCVKTGSDGRPTGEGIIYNFLVRPMGELIQFFAKNVGLGYGLAIIIVTIIVRLIILPLGLRQSYKSAAHSERMIYLQPILGPIQERMRKGDATERMAAQQELLATQKEYGVSMLGGMGCLPLLIQMPFFTAIFYAARYTAGVEGDSFLNIPLGTPSMILTAAAGILYLLQGYMSLYNLDETQRRQMRSMLYLNPAMIIIFSIMSPASVTLYWVVGGIFTIVQQAITNYLIRPGLKKKSKKSLKIAHSNLSNLRLLL